MRVPVSFSYCAGSAYASFFTRLWQARSNFHRPTNQCAARNKVAVILLSAEHTMQLQEMTMPDHDENISEANKKLRKGKKTGEKEQNDETSAGGGKKTVVDSSGEKG